MAVAVLLQLISSKPRPLLLYHLRLGNDRNYNLRRAFIAFNMYNIVLVQLMKRILSQLPNLRLFLSRVTCKLLLNVILEYDTSFSRATAKHRKRKRKAGTTETGVVSH